MFDQKKLPNIYIKMNALGYLKYNPPFHKYVEMNDMEWMEYENVINYQYADGETDSVLPFAHTAGGDWWVFVDHDTSEPMVGYCFHDEGGGEYYAKNFEDAILRNIIDYASGSIYFVNETDESDWENCNKTVQDIMRNYHQIYTGLLCEEYLNIIEKIAERTLQKFCDAYTQWYALMSIEEGNDLIKHYLHFELMDKHFEWQSETLTE